MSKYKSKLPIVKAPQNDGKSFEKLIYLIQTVTQEHKNAKVYYDIKVNDTSGDPRQFDVIINNSVNGIDYTIGIECKDYRNQNVEVGEIEQYKKKCESCLIDIPLMIAAKGFQSKAIKEAKKFNIRLYTLSNVNLSSIKDWLEIDNIRRLEIKFRLEKANINMVEDLVIEAGTKEWPYNTRVYTPNHSFLLSDFVFLNFNQLNYNFISIIRNQLIEQFSSLPVGEYVVKFDYPHNCEKQISIANPLGALFSINKISFTLCALINIKEPVFFNVKKFSKLNGDIEACVVSYSFDQSEIRNIIKTEQKIESHSFYAERKSKEFNVLTDFIIL